jgi:creatinine amidohydrolase/Fe(II)-dependent formamide hydrolase-like protein
MGAGHADRTETAATLATRPDLVRVKPLGTPRRATLSDPITIVGFDTVKFGAATLTMLSDAKQLSDIGPVGETATARANADMGKEIFEETANYLAELVEELKKI